MIYPDKTKRDYHGGTFVLIIFPIASYYQPTDQLFNLSYLQLSSQSIIWPVTSYVTLSFGVLFCFIYLYFLYPG
jgi:hypothetical protein